MAYHSTSFLLGDGPAPPVRREQMFAELEGGGGMLPCSENISCHRGGNTTVNGGGAAYYAAFILATHPQKQSSVPRTRTAVRAGCGCSVPVETRGCSRTPAHRTKY